MGAVIILIGFIYAVSPQGLQKMKDAKQAKGGQNKSMNLSVVKP